MKKFIKTASAHVAPALGKGVGFALAGGCVFVSKRVIVDGSQWLAKNIRELSSESNKKTAKKAA